MTIKTAAGSNDAEVMQRLAESTRQAEILRAVIESISGDLAPESLLRRMLENAVILLGAQHGVIGLVVDTPEGPAVRDAAFCNVPSHTPPRDLPPGVGLGGSILKQRGPIRLDRYDQLQQPSRTDIAGHAMLGVPIWWGDRVAGYIGVGAPPPHRFDDDAIETLTLFARHAAIAIEIARQFEHERRRAARTAVINRIGGLITGSLSLEDVLHTAVASLAEHLHYHNVALMLVDPRDPDTLVLRMRGGVYADDSLGEYRQSIHDGITGAAARSRRPLLINDVRADPRYIAIPGGDALIAELAIPLVVGDRLLGLLNIESEQPITEEDAADFEIVAVQLAIAIDNARLFAETRSTLDETRLLYETIRRISTATDVDEVIQAYLEQVAARDSYICHVVLYEFDDAGRPIAVVVRGRWSPREGIVISQTRLPRSRDAFDPELDAGRTVTITDFRTDPRVSEEFYRTQLERGAPPCLAMIPLMAGGERIGLVILSRDEVRRWQDADLHPYQVTAAQLATAIDHRRQARMVADRDRRLAILEERQRLARELHDAVTQSVFSVSLIAQSILPALHRDPAEAERRLGRLIEQSLTAMTELRAVLAELRPADSSDADDAPMDSLDDGLAAALDRLSSRLSDHAIEADLDISAYLAQLPAHERALYRIAQEALSNVVKHAHARRVAIALITEPEHVRLTIADDGIGVSAAGQNARGGETTPPSDSSHPRGEVSSPSSGGLGFTSMRERAEQLGGSLQLRSNAGSGTAVVVTLPRRDA